MKQKVEACLSPQILGKLACLQAFLDVALSTEKVNNLILDKQACREAEDILSQYASGDLEAWLLNLHLSRNKSLDLIANYLQRTEAYDIAKFLIMEGLSGEKLSVLSRRYGLSVSYFRQLCVLALGGTPKATLREWRMARSLLDFVDGGKSLTEVAIEHGYASSSHFSNEARQLFGLSPRQLMQISKL